MNTILKNKLLAPLNLLYRISPRSAICILFRMKNHYKLNIFNPKTFNEKLQWYKMNYKNPLLTKLVDKYTVRDYVASIDNGLLVPLLWSGFDVSEIPWNELPDKFVIKTTHGSGFDIICKDKHTLDIKKTNRILKKWLKTKF